MRHLLLILLIWTVAGPASAQIATAPGAAVGINLAPLNTGTPELQADYFFNRYFGLTAGVVYRFRTKALIGGMQRYNTVVTDMRNAAFKIGAKGQLAQRKPRNPVPWVQALYIYSAYDESGYDEESGFMTPHHYNGSASAFAASIGCDFPAWRRLDIRTGFQFTLYNNRNEYLAGRKGDGFQPPAFILGINYRLGPLLSGAGK